MLLLNKKIIILSLVTIFLNSCQSTPVRYDNICSLMSDKISWYKTLQKIEQKRGVPKHLILAFIKQESSFNAYAQPPSRKLLGFFPIGSRSSAYGFSQAKKETWKWYTEKTNKTDASRTSFADSSDFIAWYILQSRAMTNIKITDTYNQYLAYHEGHGGFKNRSYKAKPWLKEVAKKVQKSAKSYQFSLNKCSKKLDNSYSWSYF